MNVNWFSLQQDDKILSNFQPKGKFLNVMYFNLFENLLSYISNFKANTWKFQSKTCRRHFDYLHYMKRHQRTVGKKIDHTNGSQFIVCLNPRKQEILKIWYTRNSM